MVIFTDCKINIGLDILRRRADGYHDISTCMVHVPWHDVVEIIPAATDSTTLTVLGNRVDCPPEKNLVMKAWRALSELKELPPADIFLQKTVPDGAGLGGGSADATYTLRLLNRMYSLGMTDEETAAVAARIGADCAFFAHDRTMMASGVGDILTPLHLDLSGYTLALVKPSGVSISTAQAYAGVVPHIPDTPLEQRLQLPVEEWQGVVVNAFEEGIFRLAPVVGEIKRHMLGSGAAYASMSGSGASVYGLFRDRRLAVAAVAAFPEWPQLVHSF